MKRKICRNVVLTQEQFDCFFKQLRAREDAANKAAIALLRWWSPKLKEQKRKWRSGEPSKIGIVMAAFNGHPMSAMEVSKAANIDYDSVKTCIFTLRSENKITMASEKGRYPVKFIRTCALALLLFCSNAVAVTNNPMSPTVWVSSTNCTAPQRGTQKYPFDGSTVEKFDALMRGFPPYSTIHLLEGVFKTTGNASYNDGQGWWTKEGWRVKGRGIERTVVRQISYPQLAIGARHGTFEMEWTGGGHVQISDLTVDENWPALNVPSNTCTFAVSLRGDNCVIRNVRAINGHGDVDTLLESFSITISSRHVPHPLNGHAFSGWEFNTNALIESCFVSNYTGNYGIAISIMPRVKGRVRNCVVSNFVGTAPFGMVSGVTYEGNLSVNCFGGYYTDTGEVTNVVIRNCKMINGTGFAIHSNPVLSDPILGVACFRDVLIDGCTIQARQIGIALSGILGPGYQSGITIRRNTFLPPAVSLYPPAAIISAYVDGLIVEDNKVDQSLFSELNQPSHPSTNAVSRRNYLLQEPAGLGTSP